MARQRNTKIICTIGPATADPEVLDGMIEAGMDALRVNFSHGGREQHAEFIRLFREATVRTGKDLPIIGDLQGPRIRIGAVENEEIELVSGQMVTIRPGDDICTPELLYITYDSLAMDIGPGAIVLIGDGLIKLQADRIEGSDIICRVLLGGKLKSRKGINLPGTKISEPTVTEKDRADLQFMLENDFDFVAQSFVQTAEDIRTVKEIIAKSGKEMAVIAKIEKPSALDDLENIMKEADGLLVARGDLGVEISVEKMPAAQKRILRAGARQMVLTITATQMLESMIANPVPTRAEATDISNSVYDGTDAIMFTGETAIGKYPIEVVQTAHRIIMEAEKAMYAWGNPEAVRQRSPETIPEAICHCAFHAAKDLASEAIVVGTQSGGTAFIMSKRRPRQQIVGISASERAIRKMHLYRGVRPVRLPRMEKLEESISLTCKYLLEKNICAEGDSVVMTFGHPLKDKGNTNLLKIIKL